MRHAHTTRIDMSEYGSRIQIGIKTAVEEGDDERQPKKEGKICMLF